MTLAVMVMLLPLRWRKQLRLARTICLGRAGGLCKNDGFVCAHDWLFACGDHMNVIALGSRTGEAVRKPSSQGGSLLQCLT